MSESDSKRGKGAYDEEEYGFFDLDSGEDELMSMFSKKEEGEEKEGGEERIEELQIEKDVEMDELFAVAYHVVFAQQWKVADNDQPNFGLGYFIMNLATNYFMEKGNTDALTTPPLERHYRRFFQSQPQYKRYNLLGLQTLGITKEEFVDMLKNFVVAKQRKHIYPKPTDTNLKSFDRYVELVNYINNDTGCEIRKSKSKEQRAYDVFVSNAERFAGWIEKADDIRMEYQKVKVKDILVFCNMRWHHGFQNSKFPLIMVHRIRNQDRKRFLYIYPTKKEGIQPFNSNYWTAYTEKPLVIWYNETLPSFFKLKSGKTPNKLYIPDQDQEETQYASKLEGVPNEERFKDEENYVWPGKDKIETCITCGISSNRLYTCGDCQQIIYCGVECQKKDWHKTHKYECK